MDINKVIEILEAIASGCSPVTGEVITKESILNERDVISALQVAIYHLKFSVSNINIEKQEVIEVIDLFKKEGVNFTEEAINQLKLKVIKLEVKKTENLSEYVQNARIKYPRAFES